MDNEKWNWSLSIGFYPGILFGQELMKKNTF